MTSVLPQPTYMKGKPLEPWSRVRV